MTKLSGPALARVWRRADDVDVPGVAPDEQRSQQRFLDRSDDRAGVAVVAGRAEAVPLRRKVQWRRDGMRDHEDGCAC